MCQYHSGSIYEPPSWDECEAVTAKAEKLVRERLGKPEPMEWDDACDEALEAWGRELAAEYVHPRSTYEETKEDYR